MRFGYWLLFAELACRTSVGESGGGGGHASAWRDLASRYATTSLRRKRRRPPISCPGTFHRHSEQALTPIRRAVSRKVRKGSGKVPPASSARSTRRACSLFSSGAASAAVRRFSRTLTPRPSRTGIQIRSRGRQQPLRRPRERLLKAVRIEFHGCDPLCGGTGLRLCLSCALSVSEDCPLHTRRVSGLRHKKGGTGFGASCGGTTWKLFVTSG